MTDTGERRSEGGKRDFKVVAALIPSPDETVRDWSGISATARKISEQHNGERWPAGGEGEFFLFDQSADAIRFAIEFQGEVSAPDPLADDPPVRSGISIGAVTFEDDLVHGATIEAALTAARRVGDGQIGVTDEARRDAGADLPYGFEYLGPVDTERLERVVEIFRLRREKPSAVRTAGLRPVQTDPADNMREASIVVLPFDFIGPNPNDRWLANGLARDVTTDLYKFRNLFVINLNSAFVFLDRTTPPVVAARKLGARYVVEGSLQKSGRRVRLNVELLDVLSERSMWREQYDKSLEEISGLQNQVSSIIVSAVNAAVDEAERARAAAATLSDARAYSFVLRGQEFSVLYSQKHTLRAIEYYDAALDLDPSYARALAAKSRTRNIAWRYGWATDQRRALDEALNLAQQAVQLDGSDARGYGELGYAHLYRKENTSSIDAYNRARLLNPNDADLIADMADAYSHSRKTEEAIPLFTRAMSLNPFYPDQYLWDMGGAYFILGEYQLAINSIKRMQNVTEGRRILTASYAMLGKIDEARRYADLILKDQPDFKASHWAEVIPDEDPDVIERYVKGLRDAGLP